jgi:lipid kinase YegS
MSSEGNRSLRLIVNGKAAADPALRPAVGEIREEGVNVEVRVTWEAGDAARYAAEAAHDEVDVVVAAGGDGTVNEVVNGIMSVSESPAVAMGVVPYGTANDFATACGILKGDPLTALRLAAHGEPRPIDVGKVNDRYFLNVASGGFGARVTAETPINMKKVMGGAAYSLMGLVTAVKMTPYKGKLITSEGEEHGAMILMAVGNGRLAGGGYQVTPRAMLDDGLLDAMAVLDVEVRDLGLVLNELTNVGDENNRYVVYRQMSDFRIESEEPIHVNLDGEPMLATSFDFRVLPRRLRFVLPEDTTLCGGEEK